MNVKSFVYLDAPTNKVAVRKFPLGEGGADRQQITYEDTITADSGNFPDANGIDIEGYEQKYMTAKGTFDSATTKWQYSEDQTVWTDVDKSSLTADGQIHENSGQPKYWRLNVAGGAGSVNIDIIFRVKAV